MSELPAAKELLLLTERTSRRHAVSSLAADMLKIFGTDEDHWRSLTWQDGGRTYSLNHGDSTLFQTEQTDSDTNWLHVTGPDGEYDAFSLAPEDEERAAPDGLFGELADALNRQAARTIFALANGHLAAKTEENLRLQYLGTPLEFRDFTGAEHEPFILLRIGERENAVAYDLTADTVQHRDQFSPDGPVPARAPQEAHTRWVLSALVGGEIPARGKGDGSGRASMYARAERRDEDDPDTINDHNVEEAHETMHLFRELPADETLDIVTHEGTTVVRTVIEMPPFRNMFGGTALVPTAMGLWYDGDNLALEAFPVTTEDPTERLIAVMDLRGGSAHGILTIEGEEAEVYRGDFAATVLFEYTDQMSAGYTDNELSAATPEIAARFGSTLLKPEAGDTVQ